MRGTTRGWVRDRKDGDYKALWDGMIQSVNQIRDQRPDAAVGNRRESRAQ